jgi:hypothetical protein
MSSNHRCRRRCRGQAKQDDESPPHSKYSTKEEGVRTCKDGGVEDVRKVKSVGGGALSMHYRRQPFTGRLGCCCSRE